MLEQLKKTLWWLLFGRVPEVSVADLAELLRAGAAPQRLDVRAATEWRRSHLPGSVSVPIVELKSRLAANEFPDAKQLAGSMLAWWPARLPTEAGVDQGESEQ